MASRRPLVTVSGRIKELPAADTMDVPTPALGFAGTTVANARFVHDFIAPSYIDGFVLSATGTTITYSAGRAVCPNGNIVTGLNVVAGAAGTITGSPGASAWQHVYLKSDGTLYKTTTAPNAPYYGMARDAASSLYVDSRYLGSFRSNASSQYLPVKFDAGQNVVNAYYLQNAGTLARIISAGTSTSAADVSMASYAPANTTFAGVFRVQNIRGGGIAGAGVVKCYMWDGAVFGVMTDVPDNSPFPVTLPSNTTPKVQYAITNAAEAYFDLLGYIFQR